MIYQYITIIAIALGVAILFDFILKGVSLWHAGKNKQKGWFVALLIINSLGLLPIIYLLFFRSDKVALRKVKKDEKKALKKVNEDKKKSKEDEKTALKKVDAKKPVDTKGKDTKKSNPWRDYVKASKGSGKTLKQLSAEYKAKKK